MSAVSDELRDAALRERAIIVAWLRERSENYRAKTQHASSRAYWIAADAIERGSHADVEGKTEGNDEE